MEIKRGNLILGTVLGVLIFFSLGYLVGFEHGYISGAIEMRDYIIEKVNQFYYEELEPLVENSNIEINLCNTTVLGNAR